jgi:uncharacterized protein
VSEPLTAEQIRILACLVEKEQTTPDQYPLSTNALLLACNQRTNREPVVDYDQRMVDAAVLELRMAGLARTVLPGGSRAHKHRHVLHEAWGLGRPELALLAVLMLRGPQTPGELRSRTERYVGFTEMGEVEAVLAELARRQPPLAANLGRRPGQSQDRWTHTLAGTGSQLDEGGEPASGPVVVPSHAAVPSPSPVAVPAPDWAGSAAHAELTTRIERLEAAVARIAHELGIVLDDTGP